MSIPSHYISVQAVRWSISQGPFNTNIKQEGTEENKNRWGLQKHFESMLARWTVE